MVINKVENSCTMYISHKTSDHLHFAGADKSQFGSSIVCMGTEILAQVSQCSFSLQHMCAKFHLKRTLRLSSDE